MTSDLADDDAPESLLGTLPWRTGTRTRRTLFDAGDRLIGMLDRPELAAQAVDAVNGAQHAADADDLLDRVLALCEAHPNGPPQPLDPPLLELPPGLLADIRKHLGV